MITFKQFLTELLGSAFNYHALVNRILKNPSYRNLESQLNATDYKELRYLKHKNDVWTADASRVTHEGIARDNGLKDKFGHEWHKHSQLGIIKQDHLQDIKNHPLKLRGWIDEKPKSFGAD